LPPPGVCRMDLQHSHAGAAPVRLPGPAHVR
jgi:hypothetical protein